MHHLGGHLIKAIVKPCFFVLISTLITASRASAPASSLPAPPWSGPLLSRAETPAVYLAQWSKARNRASCALIAARSPGAGEGAKLRAATFAGGWAVAYDTPDIRSAFGVAGTGTTTEGDVYSDWPQKQAWADGSDVGYGPEGGTGPNELAYLRISGQQCLYNVWSRLGREHLEQLIDELRFVDTGGL